MTFFRKFYLKISNFVQLEANLARMYERVRRETLKNNAVTRNEQKRLFSLLFIIRKLLLFKHIFHSGFSLWFLNLFSLSFCLSTCFFLTDDLSLVFNRETKCSVIQQFSQLYMIAAQHACSCMPWPPRGTEHCTPILNRRHFSFFCLAFETRTVYIWTDW